MFRMQLWSAMTQTWEESFRYPGTLETTQRMKEMSWSVIRHYNFALLVTFNISSGSIGRAITGINMAFRKKSFHLESYSCTRSR